jgi:hypothetical protein
MLLTHGFGGGSGSGLCATALGSSFASADFSLRHGAQRETIGGDRVAQQFDNGRPFVRGEVLL